MARRNRTYRLPSNTDLLLKEGLSARIKELWASAAENSYDLYLYAAALRRRYLNVARGEYNSDFKDWYVRHEMGSLLGTMPSFTKYALAGEAVFYFANEFREGKYVNHLPISRNALYELSLLLKLMQEGKSKITQDDLEHLFLGGGKDNAALVHPSSSSIDIAAIRRADAISGVRAERPQKKRFTVPLASIYVSKEVFKINKKTGEHDGIVDLSEVARFIEGLENTINSDAFEVSSNFQDIVKKYELRQSRIASRVVRKRRRK